MQQCVNVVSLFSEPIASSPTRSNLANPQNSGSHRVPGIFRKKSTIGQFRPPLFSADNSSKASYPNHGPSTSSGSSFGGPLPIRHPEPKIEQENEPRRSPFMSGFEKLLTDQVMNNRMSSDQARKIAQGRTSSSFKNPMVKPIESKEKKENRNFGLDDERLKGIDKAMIEMIQSEIVTNLESTDWANIAGLEAAKSKIKQIAILPLIRPDLFTGVRAPPKGITIDYLYFPFNLKLSSRHLIVWPSWDRQNHDRSLHCFASKSYILFRHCIHSDVQMDR